MALRTIGYILWKDRHEDFHPEEPLVLDKDLDRDETRFSFIDVIPGMIKNNPGMFMGRRESVEYHSFSLLLQTANEWLQKHSEWEVVNCETVLFFFKQNDSGKWHLIPDATCFPLDGECHSCLLALRLWIRKREPYEILKGNIQKLQYRDFIPNCPPEIEDDGSEKVARLEQLVQRVNCWCGTSSGPLASEVITLETLNVPVASDNRVDCECTLRIFPSKYVAILRVFYCTTDQSELRRTLRICSLRFEVGVRDFVPKHVSGGGLFRKPQFEQLSVCISRANDWIRRQSVFDADQVERHLKPFGTFGLSLMNERCFEFKNAQCLEVWMRSLRHIDSGLMHCSSDRGDYLRMFRVCFVRLVAQAQTSGRGLLPEDTSSIVNDPRCEHLVNCSSNFGQIQTINLSSIIFTPADSETTVAEIKRKMHIWIETCCKEFVGDETDEIEMNSRKPRVLSAETVEIFTKNFSEQEILNETENTFQFNRIGTMNAFLYMAFRIYVDVGPYGRPRTRSKSIASNQRRQKASCIIS